MPIPLEHKTWFENVCKEAGLDDVATACEESGLVIGNVPFIFAKDLADSQGALLVQAIVGFLPKQGALPILRHILEVQLLTAGPSAPVFGVDPDSSAVILISCISPANVPPQEMLLALRLTAEAAKKWQEILEKPDAAQANSLQKAMRKKSGHSNESGVAQ